MRKEMILMCVSVAGDPPNQGCQDVLVGPRRPEEHSVRAYLLYAMSITHGAFSYLFFASVRVNLHTSSCFHQPPELEP
ncbi:hypothetical protein I79_007586 [Cricetulus griseus]|uniref:Uncharacterized protein n=1 Tax=Cricetulus griseus TaxID=10029 RepID=G3HAX6_CRIGR|nr:hypothetical protein I79_007586 [Cricetulus griseus]